MCRESLMKEEKGNAIRHVHHDFNRFTVESSREGRAGTLFPFWSTAASIKLAAVRTSGKEKGIHNFFHLMMAVKVRKGVINRHHERSLCSSSASHYVSWAGG